MKNSFTLLICLITLITLTSSSCTKKSAEPSPTASSNAESKAPNPCEVGYKLITLSGDCTGSWSLGMSHSQQLCVFNWGPAVSCPEGAKPTSHAAVCYGQTTKETSKLGSASDCEKQFGKTPVNPSYTLTCCQKD